MQQEEKEVEFDGFEDCSEGSEMHSSDCSSSDDEDEREPAALRKMRHVTPNYSMCSDYFLDYSGPNSRLEDLPQQIKEAGRHT